MRGCIAMAACAFTVACLTFALYLAVGMSAQLTDIALGA